MVKANKEQTKIVNVNTTANGGIKKTSRRVDYRIYSAEFFDALKKGDITEMEDLMEFYNPFLDRVGSNYFRVALQGEKPYETLLFLKNRKCSVDVELLNCHRRNAIEAETNPFVIHFLENFKLNK